MPGSQWVHTNPVAFLGEGMEDLSILKQFDPENPPKMAYKETKIDKS